MILVENFPHRRAGHCGSGALRDLLEYHQLSWGPEPLSEGMVFGLGGALGFSWFELPQMEPPIYLVGRTADLERNLCDHLGIGLDFRQTENPGEAWDWVREALDRGEPTMVWADIKELDYLRVRMHNTMHDIVVVGHDEGERIAWIADNDRDELQRCSLESLARARNSNAFPSPNRHGTWLMRFPSRLSDPAEAVRRALRCAVTNMREGGPELPHMPRSFGLAGVEAFARSYSTWPERLADGLGAALRGLGVFIVKAGTGGAMFRSLHAGFLADAAALLDHRALEVAAKLYAELAATWVALAHAATSGDDPRGNHAAGVPLVERIARLEHEGVLTMTRALSQTRPGSH